MNRQIICPEIETQHAAEVSTEAAETYIRAIQRRMASDRKGCLGSLDDMFRAGRPPGPLDGRYTGELVAVSVAPGLTGLIEAIQREQRSWLGKSFAGDDARGENILSDAARPMLRVTHPFYRDLRPDTANTFRALPFRTYTAPALLDDDVTVMKIDYDLPANPRLTIRRVLDELAEIADGYYLGRAYLRWWWGRWQRVAYFTLRHESEQKLSIVRSVE